MANDSAVRVAIIGAGRIGALHASNIVSSVPALSLRAVVEPAPSTEFGIWAEQHKVPIRNDADAVLSEHGIDAVLICTPTDTHAALIERAAQAGKHVFCEKPVASTIEDAGRANRAAGKAGVVLQIGFNRRFDHNFAALRKSIIDGALGTVELVRVTSRDPGPPPIEYVRRSGGLFMDMTIHDFDMVRFLTGAEVREVYAQGASLVDAKIGEAGDIDTAVISLRFSSGALGFIENSRRASYGYDQRAEVHGSLGAAATANDSESTLIVSDSQGIRAEKPLYFFLQRYSRSFVDELAAFADSVRSGRSARVTGGDGIAAMQIARACALSLKERRPVEVGGSDD